MRVSASRRQLGAVYRMQHGLGCLPGVYCSVSGLDSQEEDSAVFCADAADCAGSAVIVVCTSNVCVCMCVCVCKNVCV